MSRPASRKAASWHRQVAGENRRGRRRAPGVSCRAYGCEPLEGRTLLAISTFGIPSWLDQGPGPTLGGQVTLPGGDPVSGAIEAIAPHPTNPSIIYVGAVNGGVWRTTNGGANWTPLTDQLASLSIGDIAFSPLDAAAQTLFFGVGNFSSGGSLGGTLTGLFRTVDGGTSWRPLGLANERIREVIPTSIGTSLADQVVLVASRTNGLFRSTNGGDVFAQVSGTSGSTDGLDNDADGTADEAGELNLPNQPLSHLAADPGNANRYYAAVAGTGVFRSDNGGANWVQVNNGLTGIGGTTRVELSVSAAAGNPVYAGLIVPGVPNGNVLSNVFRSGDQGANWTAIGAAPAIHPGRQAGAHFAILAHRSDPNQVYVAGDRAGASPFVANIFVGDASSNSWNTIVQGGAFAGTAPHADARDMLYDSAGNILHSNDGGMTALADPDGIRLWVSLNGDLRPVELYSAALDTVSNTIFGGTQDTGATEQSAANSITWNEIASQNGDGGTVDVVNVGAISQHFTMGNNLTDFVRRTFVGGAFFTEDSLALSGLVGGDTTVTGLNVNPYVINAVAPNRLALGNVNLYESSDQGSNVTQLGVGGATGVSAIAYGGRLGGADNAEVIYASVGGNLFLRSAAGPNLAQLTAYLGGGATDIAVHPQDWRRVYVTDGTNVWQSVDAGQNWTNITGNLGSFTGRLQSVSVVSLTGTPGDEVVLVGGLQGVFRNRNPADGVNSRWSEYGAGLPNAVVQDQRYYGGGSDRLITATFGRGAWSVDSVSTTIDVPGVVQIDGDTDFPGQDDVIRLLIDPNNPALLNIYLNSALPTAVVQLSTVEQINVNGLGGHDTLIVDSSNGLISIPNGIRYDGGAGTNDLLRLEQTGGAAQTGDVFSVGPAGNQGSSVITGATGTQTVFFENLEPVVDLVPAATLAVNATPEHNAINYTVGSVATRGLITVDNYESLEFSNKVAVTVNAGVGNDVVNLNNASTPTGLTTISVNGAEGDDVVTTLSTIPVQLALAGDDGNDLLSAAGATGNSSLDGGTGNDVLTGGAGGDTLTGGSGQDLLDARGGANTVNGGSETDTVLVSGTSGDDTIGVTHSGGTLTVTGGLSAGSSALTSVEAVRVEAGTGSDSVTVTPSSGLVYTVLGGPPAGLPPGDSLTLVSASAVTYTPGPEADSGSLSTATATVTFDEIETLAVSGTGAATVTGTDGSDAVSVIARSGAAFGGADGVRDFTVTVNGGPGILFTDAPSLTVNTLGGSDEVTVRAPADSGAVWDVDVTVNGGAPSAPSPGGDRVTVETPGAGAETATYTPTAVDGGTLNLTSLSSLVTLAGVEQLSYDGEGDNDSLTVVGTGGGDAIGHTPGAADDAGTLRVNGLLALSYENLGAGASLSADGGGGTDALTYDGTANNDAFTVDAGGVRLNTRLLLSTPSIETLTLEGFGGDDAFTLVPALSASPYATVNFRGGAQASAAGDVANVVGSAGADAITMSGQTLSQAGKTVDATGVEDLRLDALGGANSLTYNGVTGVSEAVDIQASETAGRGRLVVPGLAALSFSNVQTLVVNGNNATSTDTDTLTFTGTNALDVVRIDTNALPVLQLFNSAGSSLLLTLQNYSGFNTLNVKTLDGEDVIDVFTGPAGGRNLFIDGGAPSGKKKSTDKLTVWYTPQRPRIIHSAATQDPDAGLVDLDYGTSRTLVQYDDIELVVIKRL